VTTKAWILEHPVKAQQWRMKLSISHKGKPHPQKPHPYAGMLGKHHTNETKLKMSQSKKGRRGNQHSDYTRRKISMSCSGLSNHMFGKHHSEDTKRKISEGNKGKHVSDETRRKMSIVRMRQVLPVKDTSIEIKTQEYLLQHNISFLTHPIMLELFQADILIPDQSIVIECDGCYWHACPTHYPNSPNSSRKNRDERRTEMLIKRGYTVIHIWEHEINSGDFSKLEKHVVWEERLKCIASARELR